MVKKYSLLAVPLLIIAYPTGPDPISYGKLYIRNKTDWNLKVSAPVKDEWDVVTPTNWDVEINGIEKIENMYKLRGGNILFWPDLEDDSHAPNWLRVKNNRLILRNFEPSKDLFVTISKDPYADKWLIEQVYITSDQIEYGGTTGYRVKALAH